MYEGKVNLIVAILSAATIVLTWPIDMLVESESVWTETPGLSDPRKLETPELLSLYKGPPVRLAFPPTTLQPLLLSTQVDLA